MTGDGAAPECPQTASGRPRSGVRRKKVSGAMSPTQRSLRLLRDSGYTVAVVERWNPHARIRQDLFGFIDLLALRDGETLAVQATSGSNGAARVAKIAEAEHVAAVRKAGWRIEVHAWRKLASGRWDCRIVDCS